MRSLKSRIESLEVRAGGNEPGRPFFWYRGQSLAAALSNAGLTLGDKPLMAIRLTGVIPGETEPRPDPLYERDRHLLD